LPLVLLALSGCISLKSDYPEINYYRLNQEPGSFTNIGTLNGTLEIRNFTTSREYDTEHLLAVWEDTKLQKYYYHRWVTPCPELLTDFFVNRFIQLNVFTGGTVKSNTILVPDFIMEGQIIEMLAHNSKKDDAGSNYVLISVQINIVQREPLKSEKNIILNKLYTISFPRPNSEVTNIPPAFSKALSQLVDKLMVDVYEVLPNYQNKPK
jgi:ABC-type uncharacterized transport system auxiliary subunit